MIHLSDPNKLISQKPLEISKLLSLPKMELGYLYQSITGQNYNRIHTDLTLPHRKNKNIENIKKAELPFLELQINAHLSEHYHHIKHIQERYEYLKKILNEYRNIFS